MLTKGAIGNLVNRYRAVLKKCNLIKTFGSLAIASMLVMGSAGVAEAIIQSGADHITEADLQKESFPTALLREKGESPPSAQAK